MKKKITYEMPTEVLYFKLIKVLLSSGQYRMGKIHLNYRGTLCIKRLTCNRSSSNKLPKFEPLRELTNFKFNDQELQERELHINIRIEVL